MSTIATEWGRLVEYGTVPSLYEVAVVVFYGFLAWVVTRIAR